MKKSLTAGFAAIVLGLVAVAGAAPGNAAPDSAPSPSSSGDIVSGQIIVKFSDERSAAGVLRQHGLGEGPSIGSTRAQLVKVPAGKELQLLQALSRNPAVEYAEPDPVVTPATDDQYFPRQYALQNDGQSFTNTDGSLTVAAGTAEADVDAVEAWKATSGTGIRVAVLDSGVANDNGDISSKVDLHANFTNGETGDDNYGHGTHVAGIVAATTAIGDTSHDTNGVAGTCPGCRILDGKVLNDSGIGSTSALANGINWAAGNGAKVINMSLAVRSSRTLESAVNNAWNKGAVLVAAAGNGGNQTKIYPAAYPNVIAVAATDNNDAKASFSTYGASWVDIAAPGVNVYSTFPNHPYYLGTQNKRALGFDVGNGTSMAAPIVAAVAALTWTTPAGTGAASVRTKVQSSAEKIAGTGTFWANGRVNACDAVGCVRP